MEQPERATIAREAERIQQATARDARRRALAAGCVGNLVEWYDFALYGAFATLLAAAFFPEADLAGGLLAAFAVFGVAFLARPAGALLFAHYGDRLGRRRALAATILLMAVVTAAIGLLPTYDAAGWLAPVLLVLLRAGQGVAIGGEYGGSAAFVVEYAPVDRRGWYGGWQWATVALGLGAGIAAAALLSASLDGPALCGWGWRLAFLLALPLGLVGLYIRLRIEETPGFRAVQRLGAAARTPLADTLRSARREVVVGFGIVAVVTATFNIVFVFLPSHLATTGRAPLARALATALAGLLLAAAAAPLAGRLSDRVGRRPLLLAGLASLLVLTVPVTALLLRGEPGGLLAGYALIGLVLGTLVPSTFLAELFPTRLRYSGLSLTYGLASGLFGARRRPWPPSRSGAPAPPSRPPGTPPRWRWWPWGAPCSPRRPPGGRWTPAATAEPRRAASRESHPRASPGAAAARPTCAAPPSPSGSSARPPSAGQGRKETHPLRVMPVRPPACEGDLDSASAAAGPTGWPSTPRRDRQ